MENAFRVPVTAGCRVIVDNDYSGDPDGLVGLAHHLLSPSNRVVAVTTSPLSSSFPTSAPRAEDGAALAQALIDRIDVPGLPPVHAGSEDLFGAHSGSKASSAIIAEARREGDLPLYVACGGPLTNVATALRDDPDIAPRLRLVWVGGSLDSDAFEYNRDTDPEAAAFVFSQPQLAIHQFPLETYRQCAYSVGEVEQDIGTTGALGQWLATQFMNPPGWVRIGGVWPLGDSPPVLVTALTDESSTHTVSRLEGGNAERRIYTHIDFRLIVGDMLARFRQHEAERRIGVGF